MWSSINCCLSCFPRFRSNPSLPIAKGPHFSADEIDLTEDTTDELTQDSCSKIPKSILEACKEEFLGIMNKPLSEDSELIISQGDYLSYGINFVDCFLVKSQFKSAFSPKTFLDFMQNNELRAVWDKNVQNIKTVSLSSDVHMDYTLFKKLLMMSQRDMLTISTCFDEEDEILLVSTSFEHHDFPTKPELNRIKIDLAGYFIKKTECGSDVFTVTKGNFGGIIPGKLMKNAVAISIQKFHLALESALQKSVA